MQLSQIIIIHEIEVIIRDQFNQNFNQNDPFETFKI
jgi:hypothetical protein